MNYKKQILMLAMIAILIFMFPAGLSAEKHFKPQFSAKIEDDWDDGETWDDVWNEGTDDGWTEENDENEDLEDNIDPEYIDDWDDSRLPITENDVSLSSSSFEYSGLPQMPRITVFAYNQVLVADQDFAVEFSNNINAGTGTVIVSGNGNYKGKVTKSFTIEKKEIGLSWDCTDLVYNGSAQKPSVSLIGVLNGDDVRAKVEGEHTEIGSYTALVTSLEGSAASNYKLPANNSTVFTISLSVEMKTSDGLFILKGDSAAFSKPSSTSINKLIIPATINYNGNVYLVNSIVDKACSGLKKLSSVNIGKNIKTIGKNAFANCAKLKTVKGGAAVTTIKDGAFSGCKVLKTFPAMNKLQKIGNNAFKGAKALAKFTLAKTVTSIGKNAFNGCAGLKTITVKTEKLTNKNVGAGAFKGINKKATFKCPKKQLKNYKTLFVKKGAPKTCKFK